MAALAKAETHTHSNASGKILRALPRRGLLRTGLGACPSAKHSTTVARCSPHPVYRYLFGSAARNDVHAKR
eukprot:5571620-Amphidinium_carterae.2